MISKQKLRSILAITVLFVFIVSTSAFAAQTASGTTSPGFLGTANCTGMTDSQEWYFPFKDCAEVETTCSRTVLIDVFCTLYDENGQAIITWNNGPIVGTKKSGKVISTGPELKSTWSYHTVESLDWGNWSAGTNDSL